MENVSTMPILSPFCTKSNTGHYFKSLIMYSYRNGTEKKKKVIFFTAKADFPMRIKLGLKLKQRLNDRT